MEMIMLDQVRMGGKLQKTKTHLVKATYDSADGH